jgi:hypothetical protein
MIEPADGAAKLARGQVQRGNTLPRSPGQPSAVLLMAVDAH